MVSGKNLDGFSYSFKELQQLKAFNSLLETRVCMILGLNHFFGFYSWPILILALAGNKFLSLEAHVAINFDKNLLLKTVQLSFNCLPAKINLCSGGFACLS
jgi:hypothetical protein